ncbi:MAG: hemin uptake protein HemP [Rhodospirillales bacterium]|jgi:hemin uptake protein HemP|nr:hemin uptake protein HemP [Rhodospirillales bacterium]
MKDRRNDIPGVPATAWKGNDGWAVSFTDCACGRPRVSSRELFPDGHSEICIEHEGMEYCLRITKQKKLILYR